MNTAIDSAETTQLLEKEQTESTNSSAFLLTLRKQPLAAVGVFAVVSSIVMIGGVGRGQFSND